DATTETDLEKIEDQLREVAIPSKYQADWGESFPGKKLAYWKQDVKAMRAGILKAEKWYGRLLTDGKQVLDNLKAPDLPGRAKKVLDEAKASPLPEKDPDQVRLPGAKTVTYATLFNFASVAAIRGEWQEMEKKLMRYSS